MIVKNKYPILLITDLFDQFGWAKYFSKLNLRLRYYQVQIAEGNELKIVNVTKYEAYEFKVMPFDLTNAPVAFCVLMNHIFQLYFDKLIVVYLDDIMVYSNTLEDNELYVKQKKCSFAKSKINFIGRKNKYETFFMDKAKVKSITEWELLMKVIELHSFLALVNYYKRFFKGYSVTTNRLTKKSPSRNE